MFHVEAVWSKGGWGVGCGLRAPRPRYHMVVSCCHSHRELPKFHVFRKCALLCFEWMKWNCSYQYMHVVTVTVWLFFPRLLSDSVILCVFVCSVFLIVWITSLSGAVFGWVLPCYVVRAEREIFIKNSVCSLVLFLTISWNHRKSREIDIASLVNQF